MRKGIAVSPGVSIGTAYCIHEIFVDPDTKRLEKEDVLAELAKFDEARDKIAEINRTIAKLGDQKRVFYLDIGAKFLDEKGVFLPNTFRPDNLHPVAKGYEIWGEAVKDKLAQLLK